MTPLPKSVHQQRRGAVLIVSMIFVLVFSALAVAMAAISGVNSQIATNQHKVDFAFASAESGLEVQRYWLTPVTMPSSTSPSDYFSTIVDTVRSDLDANGISNITLYHDGSIDSVALDSFTGQTFSVSGGLTMS